MKFKPVGSKIILKREFCLVNSSLWSVYSTLHTSLPVHNFIWLAYYLVTLCAYCDIGETGCVHPLNTLTIRKPVSTEGVLGRGESVHVK